MKLLKTIQSKNQRNSLSLKFNQILSLVNLNQIQFFKFVQKINKNLNLILIQLGFKIHSIYNLNFMDIPSL